MNSPTESSAYDTTNDSKANSDDDDEDDEAEGEEDGSRNATASWALPPMTLYSPALSRDRFISPLISPAVFSNADSSPASTPRLNGISPLPSPFLQSNNSRTSPLPSPYLPAKKQNLASAELLAPTTYMPPPPKGAKEPSSTVHYPSWSEISGFDFVKREKKAATATAMATAEEGDGEDGEGDDGQGDEEGEGQGDDGWKPVPDSAAGRYELAT
ncbi:uncharacterized protein RCC_08448 [Ramularia collo-cygni]|uniref:Uncharacterized protein n=1 Tax=Ramularia collo-cygni TaxID=112498 RepID=A0A2D3V446_9PEZI|nr:uncharacterized protein RCC_08448 [Ramularia collo-cygni]CZT22743.1 uncharacterized protein RCC_08448 [Ramularia collo-cygni]